MVKLDILIVLFGLELLLVLSGLCGFLWFRGRKLARALARARRTPPPAPVAAPVEERSYASFLNAELTRSAQLVTEVVEPPAGADGDPQQQEDAPLSNEQEDASAEDQGENDLLAVREAFLQTELAAQDAGDDNDIYRQRLLDGLKAIQWPAAGSDAAGAAKLSRRYEEELARLRAVIGNQHEIMRELESIVTANVGTDETADEARRKLELWEQQAAELERCVGVLEMENKRLRTEHNGPAGESPATEPSADVPEEDDQLRSLIGSQQETINQLHQLVQGLVPEAEKAKKLTDIIGRIERANQELNTCVVVLEDENDLLRGRVQELEASVPAQAPESQPQSGRIDELEAEIQFKDAAIEELQQQYKSLESKYAALKGKDAETG